jgi:hypothetical protein
MQGGTDMQPALSSNELELLDRQVAALSHQLSEMTGSLESRLGDTNELATAARNAQREFAKFAQRVRRRVAMADSQAESGSRSA